MFGYITPLKDELLIREYNTFKAYYCGLCSDMGKKSYPSKFALTYDLTFLAIVLSSLYNDVESVRKVFCPFKMKNVIRVNNNQFIDYAAEMNIFLFNRKLYDNYIDDKNFISLFLSKLTGLKSKSDIVIDKISCIDYSLKELNKLEKKYCDNLDEVSHIFAEITSDIFSIYEDRNSKLLRHFGYHIGKWIYVLDAYDDLTNDINKSNYNPCIYSFHYNGEEPDKFKEKIRDNIEFVLFRCLTEVANALNLLEFKKNKGIIENIVYLGMKDKTFKVLEGRNDNEKSLRNIRCKTECIPRGNKASL
ncbi:hypothetical protein Q428_04365 [Fervidicella metallireducens AeB]|uniref:Uncharacterized protein n=1 Tax=Fervidicella metallireducens AeB TaxID=1403537 RepID=A0A017RYR4_9CLOT|nr:DUF5685 family protein [Fervidicella metallireducens]EYE89045.1 hypothetical protein Q428_04365 [Fervidicella metallireducens AeB]